MSLWIAVLAVAAGSFTLKALGPAVLGDRRLPVRARDVIALLAPALLAALVTVEVLGRRWEGFDPAVGAGLLAVAAAHLLRAPMLVAVLIGVVTTALLRAAGWS